MRHSIALILIASAGTASAQDGFQSGTTRWDGKPASRGDALLRATLLAEHNAARREYGSQPLVWDNALTAAADRYVRILADEGRIAHDKTRGDQGENLFMGTRGAYSYRAMARLWIDERQWFVKGRFPYVVKPGNPWTKVGHYTQIVWPTTQRVGCAVASNSRDDFLVCRYSPSGNIFGHIMR